MEVVRAQGDNNEPPEDLNWRPPVRNETEMEGNRKKRGANSNRKMKEAYERSGYKPLPIEFDTTDKQTARPIGPNAAFFSNFIGTLADSVPKWYPSWQSVPDTARAMIWPEIETFFDMRSHWGTKYDKLIRAGVEATLGERYSGRKYDFKNFWWTQRGGPEHPREIKRFPPPNVELADWVKLCDFYNDPKNKSRAEKNVGNRSKMKTRSGHGSISYAQIRDKKRRDTGSYPSSIEHFREMHQKNGEWKTPYAEEKYNLMLTYVEEAKQKPDPIDEDAIITRALGERRGWKRGIGRRLDGGGSSSQPTQPPSKKRSLESRVFRYTDKLAKILLQHGIQPPTLSDSDEDETEEHSDDGDELVGSSDEEFADL